jgi:uncharacterized protein
MTTLQNIKDLFSQNEIAIAGVSREKNKFGNKVYMEMKKKNRKVYPINPNIDAIDGDKTFPDVLSLPGSVSALIILTKRSRTEALVKEAISKKIQNIWIQQQSETKEAIEAAEKAGINLITGECIFMFMEPVSGPHKFHRFFKKLFGSYPR